MAPHRRAVVLEQGDLEQVSQRRAGRVERHRPAEGLRRPPAGGLDLQVGPLVVVPIAQLVPPLRLVGGEIHGALPPGQMLRHRGDRRIIRTHLGQQQRLVGRAQPVAAGPRALQSPPARSGCRGPSGRAREPEAGERERRIQIERPTEPGDRVGVVGAAIRRLGLEVEPERGQGTIDQAASPRGAPASSVMSWAISRSTSWGRLSATPSTFASARGRPPATGSSEALSVR